MVYVSYGTPSYELQEELGEDLISSEDYFASIEAGEAAPISQPFNPPALGLPAFYSNAFKTAYEIMRQQISATPTPPSFTYEGPIGGAGPLGLLAPLPDSQKYREFVTRQQDKEIYNPEKSGIMPLAENQKSTAIETAKQTQGPNLWERFTGAVQEGYTKEPEDVNTFTKSIEQLKAASLGIVKPSNYALLAVCGVALLLVLIIK